MLRTRIGKVPASELDRLRAGFTRRQALELNPRAYSATESEQILMALARIDVEIIAMFDIDELRTWRFSILTGDVWYEDD